MTFPLTKLCGSDVIKTIMAGGVNDLTLNLYEYQSKQVTSLKKHGGHALDSKCPLNLTKRYYVQPPY